jgi:hypothetical protein
MRHRQWRTVLIAQILFLAVGTLFPSAAVRPSPSSPGGTGGRLVVRVYVRDRDHLNAVAGELDIWEVHLQEGHVVAAITVGQRRWLEELGYRVEIDPGRTSALSTAAPLDPRFYYFDQQYANPNGRYVVDFLQEINAAYPSLTELVDAGDAWMAGQPGEPDRDIWVLRVTNEDPAYGPIPDKPAFFLSAAMHAREVATAELAIRYVQYLTRGYDGAGGYGVDADVTWLVDHHVAHVLVMHNPDGHVENERDRGNNRRKNMDWDDGCIYRRYWGVDLNRNHSFLWGCCGGSSPSPCSETYRGPSRGSEPETQAFEGYFAAVMKDQNGPNGDDEIAPASPITTTGIFINLHSYSDLVLWPWGFGGHAPNHAELRTIGRKLAVWTRTDDYAGHEPAGSLYAVDGAVDDWAYGTFGIASFTFEVGPHRGVCGGFFPQYACIDGYAGRDFWAENRPAFLYAHRIAGTPYRTAYGPDVESLTLTGSGQLTATMVDYGWDGDDPRPITGAEYFVDAPGDDGAGMPMGPADGAWGEGSESAVALVDTSGLALGRHVVLVRGRSDEGQWGPFSGIFIDVGHPLYLPLVVTD